ncbi:MAG: type II toxin-antitoxin system RelE/ParE family toxin [Chloroflexaceae bacterium]|nr:type II toxin-antitoxin system RelE/ParE family toxin [Chloroflexaceae bacterium]
MSYQIEISNEAAREIKKLPGYVRAEVRRLVRELGDNPYPPPARELQGKPGIYRLWVAGRWRMVYAIDDEALIVTIRRVRSKATIDYASA